MSKKAIENLEILLSEGLISKKTYEELCRLIKLSIVCENTQKDIKIAKSKIQQIINQDKKLI